MTATTAICIISCCFILCTFVFFTIVYLSELKRERQLRNMISEENKKMQDLIMGGNLPVVLMDMPLNKSKEERVDTLVDKDKKDVN